MSVDKHKVFISYYHKEDQKYARHLQKFYGGSMINKSLNDDIGFLSKEAILTKIRREHLRNSTVTVVLVGKHTYGRRWVDWEIYASLRPYGGRTRNGLVGVYLPRYSKNEFRLTDNIESGYAVKINWDDLELRNGFARAVQKAWNRRNEYSLIDNSRSVRRKNAPIP